MSTTFDFNDSSPEWDAVIEAIEPVHRRRQPTVDDLLDLRFELDGMRVRVVENDDRAYNDGLRVAMSAIDKLISSL